MSKGYSSPPPPPPPRNLSFSLSPVSLSLSPVSLSLSLSRSLAISCAPEMTSNGDVLTGEWHTGKTWGTVDLYQSNNTRRGSQPGHRARNETDSTWVTAHWPFFSTAPCTRVEMAGWVGIEWERARHGVTARVRSRVIRPADLSCSRSV